MPLCIIFVIYLTFCLFFVCFLSFVHFCMVNIYDSISGPRVLLSLISNKQIIRKRNNCECIATWGRSTPRQSLSALITTPCQVWSRRTYPLPYNSVFAADALLYVVTLTFDIWNGTFAVRRLWCDETLYQIWTQSSNLRRSYCDFNIWPNDLEHELRVARSALT